jgi:transcriptional regulator of acetoin/glycerol metabolism
MATNPWIAIDATTSPSLRARELRRIWYDYLSDGRLDRVRQPIAESWSRSEVAGISPSDSRAPTMFTDRREVRERWEAHPLEAAAPLIRRWLGRVADEGEHLIVVSDAEGLLLWLDGDARVRSAAADAMNFVEGALWSEAGAGTNAIGTALAADHPVQIHAAEHFSEVVHGWTCSAAPVHDPEDGKLLGVIDLTGLMSKAHPNSLASALVAARAVEADLRVRAQVRDAQLRVRYLERLASGRGKLALVSRSGRVIADHPDGFLHAGRLEIPGGGGAVLLPDGRTGFAEPLDRDGAFIVHGLQDSRASRPRLEPVATAVVQDEAVDAPDDVDQWRRTQLELSRMAEEQAALRHVATMVAGQATADEIFATVAEEVARILRAERGVVCRYEPDGTMTVAAFWASGKRTLPVGTRVELKGDSVAAMVQQLGRPSRIDSYAGLSGPVVELARTLGAVPNSTVGAPILVEGRVWGVILVSSTGSQAFTEDTESRLMGFAELVATAISNAVARAELNASRARIVAAADESRRRIERDLHDGAQQRLVSLALQMLAAASSTAGADELRAELTRASSEVTIVLDELREISRGIHPAILSEGGLVPALRTLSRRSAIPVELDISTSGRFTERIEVTGYYVVAEVLTNAVKHARASVVRVTVEQLRRTLRLSIRDDGVGGADLSRGSGLIGLHDRVEAMGGTIVVDSPAGAGTAVLVSLPLD